MTLLQEPEAFNQAPTNKNPGVSWDVVNDDDKAAITAKQKLELPLKNFKRLTTDVGGEEDFNKKVRSYWKLIKEPASASLMKSNLTDKAYHEKLEHQEDLKETTVGWMAFSFVGYKCSEVKVMLDWIFVIPRYRNKGIGKRMFWMLSSAYDGIYIEALFKSLPFFL